MPRKPPISTMVSNNQDGFSRFSRSSEEANFVGYEIAGVAKFDPATGKQFKSSSSTQSYTTYFAEALIAEAEADKDVVAIHAAMGGGTGLNLFLRRFPTRCFDVGIAEQHAVTFAAGLACEGLKPFCAIYSSFMQRAYDQASQCGLSLVVRYFPPERFANGPSRMQVVHDVDLQKLPVRFAMDRAGLVGADGPTHCGAFDVTFMACLPNMVVMAPSDEAELFHMVATAAAIDDRPSCFRYPRGNGIGVPLPPGNKGVPLQVFFLPFISFPCLSIFSVSHLDHVVTVKCGLNLYSNGLFLDIIRSSNLV